MNFWQSLWKALAEFFAGPAQPEPQAPVPVPEPPVTSPLPLEPVQPSSTTLNAWLAKAIDVCKAFEGGNWANITGNFDGTGLTCGALGQTIKYGTQQAHVKRFVEKHGEAAARALMPKHWSWYWNLCKMADLKRAISEAATITTNQKTGAVSASHKAELSAFWQSSAMKAIQVEFAVLNQGVWALRKATETARYFGLKEVPLRYYVYWFDQAVLNGKGETVSMAECEKLRLADVWKWMRPETGYQQADFNENLDYWQRREKHYPRDQQMLLIAAMLRADRAREEFDTVTMNRRGILAVGVGNVNGRFWDLKEQLEFPKADLPGNVPGGSVFSVVDSIFANFELQWLGEQETHGKNRSPKLDAMIKRQGGTLGDPYCLFGIQDIDDSVSAALGTKSLLPEGGGTQLFFEQCEKKFPHLISKKPQPGWIGIYQYKANPGKGHAVIAASAANADGTYLTLEFNTDGAGSRDGDGCWKRSRNIAGDSSLRLRGFVNWPLLITGKS